MKDGTLIIVRGLPGSGKSTFAYELSAPVVEADQFLYEDGNYVWSPERAHMAHKRCQETVEDYMKEFRSRDYGNFAETIVVSNTSTTEKELKPYYDLAEKYDYSVISVIVENRHGGKSIHDVPEETLQKMKNRFSIKL